MATDVATIQAYLRTLEQIGQLVEQQQQDTWEGKRMLTPQTWTEIQERRKQFPEKRNQLVIKISAMGQAVIEVAKKLGVPVGPILVCEPSKETDRWAARKTAMAVADALAEGGVGQNDKPSAGMASPRELADEYGLKLQPTRKALERWRKNHVLANGYIEITERIPNDPQFLYSRPHVKPMLEELKRKSDLKAMRRPKSRK
jgi:hypothetical protein